jgi:acetyl-CoA acetyltransferase
MRRVVVAGVGMTKFGRFPEIPVTDLGRQATREALIDAGLKPQQVQVAYLGNVTESRESGYVSCVAQEILRGAGIKGIPVTRVENACATGSTAIREAWIAVGAGLYDIALAVGVEKLTAKARAPMLRVSETLEGLAGFTPVGMWAMRAKRHMMEFGTTRDQIAMVAVKNRKHGSLNPRAHYRDLISLEDVKSADVLCDPLALYDACPTTDGAAAAILCTEKVAKQLGAKLVYISAAALASGTYEDERNIAVNEIERRVSKEAYEIAGIGPEDLDFAEVHDCFSIAEIVRCENLGLCPEGQGGRFVESGATQIGGKFPVNPSGGLLSKGHPMAATGVAQVCEIVWQLRGEAGSRQVLSPKAALAHCSGGAVGDDTGASAVIILNK